MYNITITYALKVENTLFFVLFDFREHLKFHQLKLNFKPFTAVFEIFGMFRTLTAHTET